MIYIASGWDNAPRVRQLRDLFASRHDVYLTYDWTAQAAINPKREVSSPQMLAYIAGMEIKGVQDAQCVLVVLPGGRGTHFEMGVAYTLGIPIILLNDVGVTLDVSFHHRPELLKCNTEAEAVHAVLEILHREHQ